MKKLTLLMVALVTSISMSFAASGTVSGTVSNAASVNPGLLVTVVMYHGTVPNPFNIATVDTTRTDTNGFYSLGYSFPGGTSGLVTASISDCGMRTYTDSTFWDTSIVFMNPVINLNYCSTPPASCNASFTASASGLTVSFMTTAATTTGPNVSYYWDFGDGSPASGVMNPTHTYASAGTYTACLLVMDSVFCMDTVCQSITVTGTPPPTGRTISGAITANSSAPGDAVVYLITADSLNYLTAVDSVVVGGALGSNYSFNVSQGTYYVKAALLPTNPNFTSYLPTYYNNSLSWTSATAIAIGGTSATGVNINLIAGLNPGGPAFVGGLVSLGANKTAGPGDPLEGAIVILTDEAGGAVAYDVTDANGAYEFPSLAYGTYKLYVDILGKTPTVRTIELTSDNEKEDDINFIVGQTNISTGITELSNVALNGLYPNPATDVISINVAAKTASSAQIVITDMVGKSLIDGQLNLSTGNQVIDINISELPKGVYLFNLIENNTVKTEKLVKY